jgi:hypothetical protein
MPRKEPFSSAWGLGELSSAEHRLCEAFRWGSRVDLRTGNPEKDDPQQGGKWSNARRVRAEVIAALLLSEPEAAPGRVPAVRLTGARVTGALSLAYAEVRFLLSLRECWFEQPICLDEATTRTVDLTGSVIPRLDANDTRLEGHLVLRRCRANSVALTDARIAGQLNFSGATLTNPGGTALNADGLIVGGDMFCDAGFHAEGETCLLDAHITNTLSFNGARLTNPGGTALTADRLIVERSMFCQEGFHAEGEIRLLGARISGDLTLTGARLTNPGGSALNADRLTVEGSMFCQEGFHAEGEIRLLGARITSQLSFIGARLTNPGGSALNADRLTVEGSMFCQEGFHAEGEIRLLDARITGPLSFIGARLTNPGGTALNADRLTVEGSMFCQEGFHAEGEIRLLGARITSQLNFIGARLTNPGRRALSAGRLIVGENMFCRGGFQAVGQIDLLGAKITGQLSFDGARLINPDRTALDCEGVEAGSLRLSAGFTAKGKVDLSGARVGTLHDDPKCWPEDLDLNELVYDDLEPDEPARKRLKWLGQRRKRYRAQPYEQLAAYYRRQGHDEEARRVLLAKYRHYRASRPWYARIFGYLLDGIVGYGYRPGRAALWMLALLAAGSIFFAHHRPEPLKADEHPHYHPVLYTADVLLPIIDLGQEGAFKHQGLAQWVVSAMIVLGWLFATAVVAGVTRVLTRN